MRRRIYLVISFFSAVFLYGQVTLISAVEDKDYRVNQKITLTFVLKIEGSDYVQESPLRLPDFSNFNVLGNASDQNSYVDPESKIIINQMVYQWVVSPKHPGKARIGSALVDVNGRTYKTEPIDIFIKDSDKKNETPAADAYLSLEVDKKEVYENQPFRAVLRLFSKDIDNFRRVENVHAPATDAFQVLPTAQTKSYIEPVSERPDWSSQVLAVYLIIPEETGKVVIPQFSANIKHADNAVKLSSPAVKISVKNYPKAVPAGYKNAVGRNFSLSLTRDGAQDEEAEKTYQVGRPFNITLKFFGEGTFDESSVPKLKSSQDYIFYPPTVTNQSQVSADGRRGSILVHYVVVPKKSGNLKITTENFSFFNPAEKKFSSVAPAEFLADVYTPEELESGKTTIEKVAGYTDNFLNVVNPQTTKTHREKTSPSSKNTVWPVLLALAAVASLILFWKKNKKKAPETGHRSNLENSPGGKDIDFSTLAKHISDGDFSQFFDDFDVLVKSEESRAKSLGYRGLLDFVESVHGTRMADNLRALLSRVEIERFAPVHSQDYLKEILGEITSVFSQLQNNR